MSKTESTIPEEINRKVARLTEPEQRRVLDAVERIANGGELPVPGSVMLERIKGLFPDEDAEEMMRAIEEDCERIDPADW